MSLVVFNMTSIISTSTIPKFYYSCRAQRTNEIWYTVHASLFCNPHSPVFVFIRKCREWNFVENSLRLFPPDEHHVKRRMSLSSSFSAESAFLRSFSRMYVATSSTGRPWIDRIITAYAAAQPSRLKIVAEIRTSNAVLQRCAAKELHMTFDLSWYKML